MMMGFGLIWIVLLVVGLLFLAREGFGLQKVIGSKQSYRQEDANAMDILNQRYARGEITSEQYYSMKKDLE